jgi:hypothetical protein
MPNGPDDIKDGVHYESKEAEIKIQRRKGVHRYWAVEFRDRPYVLPVCKTPLSSPNHRPLQGKLISLDNASLMVSQALKKNPRSDEYLTRRLLAHCRTPF